MLRPYRRESDATGMVEFGDLESCDPVSGVSGVNSPEVRPSLDETSSPRALRDPRTPPRIPPTMKSVVSTRITPHFHALRRSIRGSLCSVCAFWLIVDKTYMHMDPSYYLRTVFRDLVLMNHLTDFLHDRYAVRLRKR